MSKREFNVERTKAGLQLVIPGTEKPVVPPPVKYAHEGDQLVIPGAEQVSEKALLDRIADKPLRPRAGQRSLAGTPLFGKSRPR